MALLMASIKKTIHNIEAHQHIDANVLMALLMAYMKKTIYNIDGTSTHWSLHLPLLTNTPSKLSFHKLDMLSNPQKNLQWLSSLKFSWSIWKTFCLADSHFRAIMHRTTKTLGGLDVILCSNLFQASPIQDSWILNPILTSWRHLHQAIGKQCEVALTNNKQCVNEQAFLWDPQYNTSQYIDWSRSSLSKLDHFHSSPATCKHTTPFLHKPRQKQAWWISLQQKHMHPSLP